MRPHRRLTFLLFAAAVAAVASCSDAPLTAPTTAPDASGLLHDLTLLQCSPLTPDSVTQTVGPLGGVINVGPHRLSIPAGALAAPVAITAVAPADTVNRIELFPEGLVFAENAWLTMSYANCGVVGWLLPKRVVHTDSLLEVLEVLLSFDNLFAKRVTGRLEHFSTYAVAW